MPHRIKTQANFWYLFSVSRVLMINNLRLYNDKYPLWLVINIFPDRFIDVIFIGAVQHPEKSVRDSQRPSEPNLRALTQRHRTCSDALRPGREKKLCPVMQRVFQSPFGRRRGRGRYFFYPTNKCGWALRLI